MKPSSKKIRLVVMGAAGRMGGRILTLASHDPRFQVVAGVERPGSADVGHFVAGYKAPIVGNIAEVLPKTDVIIDFTAPEATIKTARAASRMKCGIVVGTTGLKSAHVSALKSLARKMPVVFSPNMSVGVNVLFELVRQAAAALPHYDIEIVEAHHNLKKDAPSGTAMRLAEVAARASGRSAKDFQYGRSGLIGARKKKEIAVLAVRAGDIVGDHTVTIGGPGERLELVHRAHSRDAFASGALDAASWVFHRRPGFYSMLDVLHLKKDK